MAAAVAKLADSCHATLDTAFPVGFTGSRVGPGEAQSYWPGSQKSIVKLVSLAVQD